MKRSLRNSPRLYEDIVVSGDVTWRSSDWQIESFVIRTITRFHRVDPLTAFHELAVAAEGHWDRVDAVDSSRNWRGDGANP